MLKDTWIDKVDGVDDVLSEDINTIAHHVINNEDDIKRGKTNYANSLIGNVIGNPIAFNDVDISPLAHDVNCYVRTSDGSIANGVDVIVTNGLESVTYTTDENGRVTIPSVTKDTVITSIPDVVIEAEYNVDTNVVPRDYVKKTDYASYSDYGIAKIASTYYGLLLRADGSIGIQKANNNYIDQKVSTQPIVPENLDYAVKAALSDCRIAWTDEEKQSARVLLGIFDNHFQTVQNEVEKITLPIGVVKPYARISEIHGMDSDYNVYLSYYTCVQNYPLRIETDNGDVIFQLPNDLIEKLTDFGVRGNYIYFDNSKAFYHQACRVGGYNDSPEEGETVEHVISDTMTIFKLKDPVVTDISEHITSDGIINMGDAEYLTVVPLVTEEDVEGMVSPDGMNGDYHFNFPTVKIIVEA